MNHWQPIIDHIETSTGNGFSVDRQQVVGGGSINNAFILSDSKRGQYFVKTNHSGQAAMFEAEARGLQELADSNCIRVPRPVCHGDDGSQSYIVLEYLDMSGHAEQVALGKQLAEMHKVTMPQFGWQIDNTIGATHQPNKMMDDWLEFWRKQRLGFQLKLAAKNGYGGELQTLGDEMLARMHVLFTGRQVVASMLHGDLWGGNVSGLPGGAPVIFDPAFYYGDREADIAMTYLFGGFSKQFYASYQESYRLDDGFEVRKTFYNIYHIINHLNLFGGGYHVQAVDMLKKVLAEIR